MADNHELLKVSQHKLAAAKARERSVLPVVTDAGSLLVGDPALAELSAPRTLHSDSETPSDLVAPVQNACHVSSQLMLELAMVPVMSGWHCTGQIECL